MSKYKFKITYRKENEYGQYWDDNGYTVSIIAESLEQAKQKLDEIEENDYGFCKNILEWEAEEIIEEKDKEIERLNNIINELEKELEYRISYGEDEETETYRLMTLEDKIILNKLQELKGDGSNEKTTDNGI